MPSFLDINDPNENFFVLVWLLENSHDAISFYKEKPCDVKKNFQEKYLKITTC